MHEISIHYKIEGRGRQTVILLHGIGGRLEAFDSVVSNLRKYYRVLRFDQRGFGKSDKPTQYPYNTAMWADDIADLMDKLSIEKAIVGGHSLGGRVVAHFAAKYPRKTIALILMNTTAWGSNPRGAEQMLKVAERVRTEGMIAATETTPWIKSLNPKYQKLALTIKKRTLMNDPKAYALAAESVAADFSGKTDSSFLKNISCPTLIIVGDSDSAPLEGALKMRQQISGSFLCVIPNCSHYSVYEKPDLLSTLIMDFVGSIRR